jgi:hypothetical protein
MPHCALQEYGYAYFYGMCLLIVSVFLIIMRKMGLWGA